MNRYRHQTTWRFLLAVLAAAVGCWAFSANSGTHSRWGGTAPAPLQAASLPASSATRTHFALDAAIRGLQARIKTDPGNPRPYSDLARAYLQKARETGDSAYYTRTEPLLRKALNLDPENVGATTLMGALCLSQHRFRDALAWGERAKMLAPSSPEIYGVLTDAHLELGNYPQAVASAQRMVNLKPGLSSYARVAHLRELMGDIEGAIEAMRMAVNAGKSGTEPLAWGRVQLGHLFFESGDLDSADTEYRNALIERPGYVHALAGQASVQGARKNYPEAVSLYTKVTEVMPSPEYVMALGDVYRVSGHREKAEQQYALLGKIVDLQHSNGVETDLEMALFNADHGRNLAATLHRTRQAFGMRPTIEAADVLAWILYQRGEYAEAYEMSRHALKLGTKDALMHFHAGMICKQLGKPEAARHHLETALAINPYFSLLHAEEAVQTLEDLRFNYP